ncbi:MAG: TonB-dependent receptor [Bacteroidales bacterium]|jgi:outer membrane receptor protein involved in Fe transport
MRKIIYLILFLLLTCFVKAQNYQGGGDKNKTQGQGNNYEAMGVIKGNINDSISSQSVEYANIVLFRKKDSSMVTGTITNEKGAFVINKVPFGNYYILCSFIGYRNLKIPNILVTPKTPEKNLGNINLVITNSNLKEVNITSEKPLMEYALDKKVINVEKAVTSTGGTAVDVLQNVPSVTVDADGNVSLRGNSNVTILIDGRPSSIDGTKLQQIPASSIENIELITNPSAKYNPEGMSGIINIKLKKKKEIGLNGMATITAGTNDKYNGSFNFNYNLKKVNIFGSYDNRYDIRSGYGNSLRTYTDKDSIIEQSAKNRRKMNSNGGKLGTDIFFNPKNTLTLTYMYSENYRNGYENTENKGYVRENRIDTFYTTNSPNNEKNHSSDYTLNYKKTYDKKGKELTADFYYGTEIEKEGEGIVQQNYDLNMNTVGNSTIQDTKTNFHGEKTSMQINFLNPWADTAKLELGLQSNINNNDNDYHLSNYDYSLNALVDDPLLSNNFVYAQQTHAVYGMYGNKYKKFTYQFGLRLEEALIKSNQKTTSEKFESSYFSFFPSIHITRKIGKTQDLQLSYSRRINRPNEWSLNPFVDYSHPGSINYGNPRLKPEYINSCELGYFITLKKTTFSADIFYRQINDVIKRIIFLDTNNIINMTFSNLSTGTSYGLEAVIDQPIFKFWKININYSYFRTKINGDIENTTMTNSNYSWTAKFSSNFYLPKKFFVQFTGFYRGPMVTPQGEMKEMYSIDFGLKKDFLKDKATLGIRVSDIFNTIKFSNITTTEGLNVIMDRKRESRVGYISFTYKINGGLKQKAKKKPDENNNGGDEGEGF